MTRGRIATLGGGETVSRRPTMQIRHDDVRRRAHNQRRAIPPQRAMERAISAPDIEFDDMATHERFRGADVNTTPTLRTQGRRITRTT
jgi:hypothetical protein